MSRAEIQQRLEAGRVEKLGRELWKRLPLKNNTFPSGLVLDRFSQFVNWVPRTRASLLEEHAKLLVLVENTLKEEILHIQLQLSIRGDIFKKIIFDLIFSGNEPRFIAYENNSYVVAPPRERQEETASLPILKAFSQFLKKALEANSSPATTS